MINEIKENVFQFSFENFGSVVYFIREGGQNILIDTSTEENKEELLGDLIKLDLMPEDIDVIILTHSHWDHIGNNNLFMNAKIITNENTEDLPEEFRPIQTKGHTQDSFCLLYEDILFSGDTIFHHGGRGRTDLEGGNEEQILESIENLKKINYKILCPGHLD
jgi:glyoxylase-like metal-dependent hydrolase (beta-lactamase superfamily II)